MEFTDIPCGFLIYSYEQNRFRIGKKRKNYVRVHFLRIAADQRRRGLSHVLLTGLWLFGCLTFDV